MRVFLVLALALLLAQATSGADKQIKLRVTETAGIRRFGYPVTVRFDVAGPVKDTKHFRLLDGGKPVSAQFRPKSESNKNEEILLDFNASLGPLETHDYVVEYGPGVTSSEPKSGLRVEKTKKEFRIVHPNGLQFVVPRDLTGLLDQVQTNKLNFLNPESTGMVLKTKHYKEVSMKTDAKKRLTFSEVIKEGPLAVQLHYHGFADFDGIEELSFSVDMEFPHSKSWVRVTWHVDDERGKIASLGADLNLLVEGEPTLIDFGAGTSVYAQLKRGESARLRQNPSDRAAKTPVWETFLGPKRELKPLVVAPGTSSPARDAEGWAHVMDRERCTAVAVAGFAKSREGADITVDADGGLRVWQHFGNPGGDVPRGYKDLIFWLHFVDMPVHVGAATSPQAMLAPLAVEFAHEP